MLTSVYTPIMHAQHAGARRLSPGKLHRSRDEHLSLAFEELLKTPHDGCIELRKHVVEEKHAGLAQFAFKVGELGQLEEHRKQAALALRAVTTQIVSREAELDIVAVRSRQGDATPYFFPREGA